MDIGLILCTRRTRPPAGLASLWLCYVYWKHLIFECSALDHIRHNFSVTFIDHHSVRSFMNQVSQRDVLHFVCDCLDYYSLLADVGVADAQ